MAVLRRIERSYGSVEKAAKAIGLSAGAIYGLWRRSLGPRDETLEALTGLGFTFPELAQLRTRDIAELYGSGSESWSKEGVQVAIVMNRMAPGGRALMLNIAEGIEDLTG